MKNRFVSLLAALLATILCGNAAEVMHSFDIAHPGIPEKERVPSLLTQVQDDQGSPLEYYMDVDSVVCGDGKCEIIKVRIHWDVLGDYQRYELPWGGNLTKMAHVPFSSSDHEKLQSILSNPASPLATFEIDKVDVPGQAGQEVDAVTKATPLFYQNSVVSGAVYTCYTLWHWANGDARRDARKLTEETCTDDLLLQYVGEGSEKLAAFAMEQFAGRGLYGPKYVDAVTARVDAGPGSLAEAASEYFESSLKTKDPGIYYHAMEHLFASGDTQKRTLYLRSLTEVTPGGPPEFYDRMADWLPRLETYFEVHLLLTLLSERAPRSEETVKQALLVLDNKNFLIARRAFWFLKDKQIAAKQQEKVDDFRLKYEGRL